MLARLSRLFSFHSEAKMSPSLFMSRLSFVMSRLRSETPLSDEIREIMISDIEKLDSKALNFSHPNVYERKTMLMLSADNNHHVITKKLIAAKANLELKDEQGNTAFQIASMRGNIHSMKYLMDAKADITNSPGAVMVASRYNQVEMLESLQKAKVDILAKHENYSALKAACLTNATESIKFLLAAKADVNEVVGKKTALMTAAEFGRLESVNLLVEAKADVNYISCDEDKPTPPLKKALNPHVQPNKSLLMYAAKWHNNEAVFDRLIELKASIHYKNHEDHGVLTMAILSNSHAKVKKVIECKADISEVDVFALFYILAYSRCDAGIVKLLLDAKVDVNTVNLPEENVTLLHFAASKGNDKVVKVLLDAKADPAIRHIQDRLPIEEVFKIDEPDHVESECKLAHRHYDRYTAEEKHQKLQQMTKRLKLTKLAIFVDLAKHGSPIPNAKQWYEFILSCDQRVPNVLKALQCLSRHCDALLKDGGYEDGLTKELLDLQENLHDYVTKLDVLAKRSTEIILMNKISKLKDSRLDILPQAIQRQVMSFFVPTMIYGLSPEKSMVTRDDILAEYTEQQKKRLVVK